MAQFPLGRNLEQLPGVRPVAKFTSRQTAARRIWAAIQNLAPQDGAQAAGVGLKRGRARKRTTPASEAREGSKTATMLELLRRREGATLKELMGATEWQAHSVRGFISTLGKKMDFKIESSKRDDGERTYSIQV
jgi:Protein of unknown function (DUF3489)